MESVRETGCWWLSEVTGALDATTAALLRRLGAKAAMKGHRDGTAYGTAATATHDFVTHHMRALRRLSVATSVGESMIEWASCLKSRLWRRTPLPAA